MPDLSEIDRALTSIVASRETLDLLRDLHTQALTEPPYVSTDSQHESVALERFVALEPDKCALVYLMLRSSRARFVVEAGTSFGVSTIYLALAVSQNAALQGTDGQVIATENESVKASRARQHWAKAEDGLERLIDLREGDLRETLKTGLPEQIDFLLLDSKQRKPFVLSILMLTTSAVWSTLALPTLRLVAPRMKPGALVVADNIIAGSAGYRDLLAYLDDPQNGFRTTTAPYAGGLLVAVYTG